MFWRCSPIQFSFCLFHAFLTFSVKCSVLCHSISIFIVLELSPFGTQIKDVSCDPGLLDWAVFAKDLIGCVSYCCIEDVRQHIHIHVRVCCKLPSYLCLEDLCNLRVLQLLEVKSDPCVALFFRPLQM